jgi:glycine/D-amino acid oxidase-like deaminating enzyme
MVESADVVVVGAGILGASAAAHLLEAGALVVRLPNRGVAAATAGSASDGL